MAVLGTSKLAWTYYTDDGVAYVVSAEADIVSQGKSGGIAAVAGLPTLPPRFRMRRRYVSNGTVTRAAICYKLDAPLWTTLTTVVSLNLDSVSTVFTAKDARLGEKTNQRQVTAQTS